MTWLFSLPRGVACGTPSAVDVGQLLTSLCSAVAPGHNLRRLRNEAADLPRLLHIDAEPAPSELRAFLDGASVELIGWGTALGFSQICALADRLAAGICLPWAAYQSLCALSEASRGSLVRTLQLVPLDAWMPGELQRRLAPWVRDFLPLDLACPDLQHRAILGLAACAVLYELTRQQPVQPARSPVARALLHRLRQLRAALNLLDALHRVANAGGVPSAAQSVCCGSDGTAPDAWPLPGAMAKSGKSQAPPPRKPPGPARRPSHALLTVKPSPHRRRGRPGKAVVARAGLGGDGVGAGGGATGGEANKEAMFSVLPGKKSDPNAKVAAANDKPPAPKPDPPATAVVRHVQWPRGAPSGTLRENVTTVPAPALQPDPMVPSCIPFHHAQESLRQVKKARLEFPGVRFCVHDRARPLFESLFNTAIEPRAHGRAWMVAWPIRERYAPALRAAPLRRYNGLGELRLQVAREAHPMGDDDLYHVATLSMLPPDVLHEHGIPPSQVLAPGTFRLVEHRQLDDRRQWLLTYFIQRDAADDPGSCAGFMPVAHDAAGYSVVDDTIGLVFASETLQGLAEGIERLTGWHHAPAPASAPASQACTLFVSQQPATQHASSRRLNRINHGLHFFDPVRFGDDRRLLRTCFMVDDGTIIIADAAGRLHTLVFGPEQGDAQRRVLNAQRPHGRAFVQALGLEAGQSYTLQEAVRRLEEQGFTAVSAEAVRTPRAADEHGKLIAPPALSTFHLANDRIDYVDHDASLGTLRLATQGHRPGNLRLAQGNDAEALAFAYRLGLQRGRGYTLYDLKERLHADGFVQLDDAEGGQW